MGKIAINFAESKNADCLRNHEIEKVNISGNVSQLRFQTADLLGLRPEHIDIIFGGRCLQDDKSLEDYGITNGATILVLKKFAAIGSEPSVSVDETKINAALKIARSRRFEQVLERVLGNPSTLASLMAMNRSLANDPIMQALVQDSNLLRLCTKDDASWKRALEAHPGLADVIVQLTNLMSSELQQLKNTATRQPYAVDRADDEDDDEDDDLDSVQVNPNLNLPTLPRGSAITTDFFRQAMLAVAAASRQGSGQASNVSLPPVETYELQLRQLRDMGITDEVMARRALQMTGGDVQAAMAYIFGDP